MLRQTLPLIVAGFASLMLINAASAGNVHKTSDPNFHGSCGQQVSVKHPGLKKAEFNAEYTKCTTDTAAGKDYRTD